MDTSTKNLEMEAKELIVEWESFIETTNPWSSEMAMRLRKHSLEWLASAKEVLKGDTFRSTEHRHGYRDELSKLGIYLGQEHSDFRQIQDIVRRLAIALDEFAFHRDELDPLYRSFHS